MDDEQQPPRSASPRGSRGSRTASNKPRAVILTPVGAASTDPNRGDVAPDWPVEADENLFAALRELGYDPSMITVSLDDVARKVSRLRADVVVNLCDGFGELDGYPGVEAIDALERRGLPYTGAMRQAYWVGCDKLRMKLHFLNAGVSTPASQVFGEPDEPLQEGLVFPLFVKPVVAGGSGGIELGSVVFDERELRARLETTISEFGPALVERYVDGREMTVGIFGDGEELQLLPPLEITFGQAYPRERRVRTFATKSDPTSPLYHGFGVLCPAPIDGPDLERLYDLARRAYQAIGGSGYGRVDFRIGPEGPLVLEVNPNCSLEWIEGDVHDSALFPLSCMAAGLSLTDMYRRMIEIALARPRAALPRPRPRRGKTRTARH